MTTLRTMVTERSVVGLYPKTMLESGNILCFKDFGIIAIGDRVTSINGHGKSNKYFHTDCFDRLHH